jgi:hypothetical protein
MKNVQALLRLVVHFVGNFIGGLKSNFADRCVRQVNAAEFIKVIGGMLIRPKPATTWGETLDVGRVMACQTESYVNGKGVGFAVETVLGIFGVFDSLYAFLEFCFEDCLE